MSVALLALLAAGGGLIGFLLAVLGAGGSILLMPLLVSGAALPTREAVPLSLLVVTLLAVVNAGPYLRRRQVAVGPALILGLPALAGSWIGGRVVKAGLVSEPAQLLIFAFAALVAAWLMLRRTPARASSQASASARTRANTHASSGRQASALLAGQGLVVGLLTGVAGVGGGFALVPALVLIAGLPMQLASGTSLVLIAANSLVALAALGHWPAASLPFTLPLIGGGLVGAVLGQRLAPHLPDRRLRQGFAALLVGSALLTGFSASQRHAGAAGRPVSPSLLQRQSSQGNEGTIAGVRSR